MDTEIEFFFTSDLFPNPVGSQPVIGSMYREQMELGWFRFKDWVKTLVMKRFKPNKSRGA